MDIAAMSINMNMASLQQAASLAMAKKAMDLQTSASAALIQQMQSSAPSFGHSLDVRA
ncbi:MAG: YjfB family protein [Angelakisella sp.]